MGAFDPFLTDPDVLAIVRARGPGLDTVALLRESAADQLRAAIDRVPRASPRIVDLHHASGINPAWHLDDDDDVIEFVLTLPQFAPTPAETRAAALLRACVAAKEAGEITPVAQQRLGEAMKRGRKENTGSAIRKAIARLLRQKPRLTNPELWARLAKAPPKGWTFFDNHLGKYIEGPDLAKDGQKYSRFITVCGEERRKLKL